MTKTRIFVYFMLIALIPTAFAAEIHDAARAGDLAKVKSLIEKDPGLIRAVDSEGKTPLHGAAEIGRKEVAAYLIEKGAVVDQRDSMNRTPLWWCAARSQSVEIARLLLDKGADINATDDGWGPPLMMAAVGGSAPMVDLFLERGVSIPGPSDPAMTGLMRFSVQNGLVKLVNRLISTGLNVLAKDGAGNSLMHKAAAGGSPEIIEMFVKAGLSAIEANSIDWTPLHYAAEAGRLQAVELLLAKGAPLNARTTEGKTALNLAFEWKKKDVADFLTAKGADRSEPKFPVLTGPYLGRKLPGKTPELFAPGIVAAKYAFHGGVAFSPDGTSAYWSIQEYGGQMASLESMVVDGRWTMPKPMSFVVLGQTDDVPFPSPDGRKLYFVSGRPLDQGGRGGKENIWVMDKTASGWSAPQPLPQVINAMNMHWQVSVDLRGNLYFGAREEGGRGLGLQDIYWSQFENGTYAKPENLGAAINGPGFEHSPFIAPDGSYLIFSKSNPQARVDSLFISFRKPDGTWSRSRELNSVIGYRNRSMCPWVTPEGKYLFFAGIVAGENMPFWVEAGFIEDLRKAALLPLASEIVGATIEKDGLAAAEAKFKELRAQPDKFSFVERDFNLLGYRFLQSNALPEAIAVFRMNIELFPESANNYDSLGEAYMTAGDKAASKANYQRAVDKDPNSANAKNVLASFDSIFERTPNERKIGYRPGQQTGLKGPYFGPTPPGEATIWYLGHCGFAVKTETKLLVFDYVKKPMRRGEPAPQPPAQPALANGWINPDEIKDLDVVVFVSHSHGDHYDEVIRTWAKTVKNIHYVFGWDAGAGANVHSLAAPRASAKFDGLEIETVNSHHSGVPESAFLVKANGLTIYHNGDYVGRMGDFDTTPSNVPADMDYLKTKFKTVDFLFLDAFVADYQIQILQSLKPNILFPMHYGGQEEKLKPFVADLKKAGVDIPVFCPAKPGDRFEYRSGTIIR